MYVPKVSARRRRKGGRGEERRRKCPVPRGRERRETFFTLNKK
jgi:hypothetical protein